jgi:general secretion pathway protein F
MPVFHYRALTELGDVVTGSIAAASSAEVGRRIEYLGLIPIGAVVEHDESTASGRTNFNFLSRPRDEDITIFTGDLALLLKTGTRINDALELLASDSDAGRMRPTIGKLAAAILSGESFGEALSHYPQVFSPIYIALVRVGESSGTLVQILDSVATERRRAEVLRRRVVDTLRYPAFLLFAAGGVLLFFLVFVLPQFADVFRDFNAKLDPTLVAFLATSKFVNANASGLMVFVICFISLVALSLRRPEVRRALFEVASRLPFVRLVLSYRRTALFCRNLGLLLTSGTALPASLRILADMMAATGHTAAWTEVVDKVRQGGKLSEALSATQLLPGLAVRTLRLGEDSGQLPLLAERIAEFYEAKLQRSLARMIGIIGPATIVVISVIVGGLIVTVMTALLSVNQMVN